ncbi:hypothetical protein ABW19_dt0207603 [Dactylella cylindrospora]|nr:hypothetical protein ABW19_dt0207603 [Dactylella cylindrospora]
MAPTYVVDFEPPEKEKQRLNLQHQAVIDNFGFHLPPVIPDQDKLTAVADVATGTGIWLEDLSAQLPSTVALDGYDITNALFPDPSTLPPNVTFSLLNVLEPVPEALYEKYDVIHIRGLCFVLKTHEWNGVMKNISKMLKPGGYFIWVETDPAGVQCIPPTPVALEAAELFGYMCKLRGGDPYCTRLLPTLFTSNNFTLLTSPSQLSPSSTQFYTEIPGPSFKPHTIRPFSRNFVRAVCSVISFMAQNNIPNRWFTPDTAQEFADKFVKETEGDEGSCLVFDLACIVGRKGE